MVNTATSPLGNSCHINPYLPQRLNGIRWLRGRRIICVFPYSLVLLKFFRRTSLEFKCNLPTHHTSMLTQRAFWMWLMPWWHAYAWRGKTVLLQEQRSSTGLGAAAWSMKFSRFLSLYLALLGNSVLTDWNGLLGARFGRVAAVMWWRQMTLPLILPVGLSLDPIVAQEGAKDVDHEC